MLVAPKFSEINIPLIDPATEVVNLVCDPIEDCSDTFVRGIRVAPDANKLFTSLDDYLQCADQELEQAASECDATVVPHEWGLFKLPDNPPGKLTHFERTNQNMVPEGYILVAETELIKEISWMLNLGNKISVAQGIRNYRESKKPGELAFIDNYSHQYASGITLSSEGKRVLWLVDIDPEIGLL